MLGGSGKDDDCGGGSCGDCGGCSGGGGYSGRGRIRGGGDSCGCCDHSNGCGGRRNSRGGGGCCGGRSDSSLSSSSSNGYQRYVGTGSAKATANWRQWR